MRGFLIAATGYYVLIALSHPFFETGVNLVMLEGLAVLAGVTSFSFWRRLGRRDVSLPRLEVAALSVDGLMLINTVAYLLMHFEPLKLVYFVLMALVFATSGPSRRVVYGSVAAAMVGLVAMAREAPGDLLGAYAFVGVAGMFGSVGMSMLMRGAVLRALRARLDCEALNAELAARLAENERLSVEAQNLALVAQAANRAKTEFLANISHEIRTPLNGVLGMAQVMGRGELAHDQRSHLAVVQSSALALLDVVNDVLDISRIEAGRMDITPAPFALNRFADSIRRLYAELAAEKGLSLALTLGDGAGAWRLGDEVRLRQVLSNLVSNAIKFTEAGRIEVVIDGDVSGLQVSVTDTGPGIPSDQQAQIFEKFVQADGSRTRRVGGTGLGLAICRELVGLMGGAIGLESTEGAGSRFAFHVAMPIAAAAATTPAPAPEAAVGLMRRALVVDDNATNRTVLQALLNHLDIVSGTADDGEDAVAAWEAGDWDIILMDIHMPRLDGLAASREIRAREHASGRPRTPIVAVTASVLAHETEAYFTAGMDGVVAKPIEVQRLAKAIGDSLMEDARQLSALG